MDVLGKLFGSDIRVRLMRLLINNPDETFELPVIVKRLHSRKEPVAKELRLLTGVGFAEKREFLKKEKKTRISKKDMASGNIYREKKVKGYGLNKSFELLAPLKNLVVRSYAYLDDSVADKFKRVGTIKFLSISGAFLSDEKSPVDVLIVADKIRNEKLNDAIKGMESEMGLDIRYAVLTPEDMKYRIDMNDRFLLSIFERPHKVIIKKMRMGQIVK